ncbi:MAG: GH92 family glycosyl hydrolase, partial [Opitutales bacterium]|nr:GH92 family glycosyl hydrolase [Opitutales bacterium]
FIGTAYNGHTFPGACAPLGLVQASPDTGNSSWRYCSGYNCEDARINMFSQTHLNGTGCGDLGDAAIMPIDASQKDGDFSSSFDKKSEFAEPAYYRVYLNDAKANVEITALNRTAFYKIRFDGENPMLVLDLQHGIISAEWISTYNAFDPVLNKVSPTLFTGGRKSKMWVERETFFAMSFSRPAASVEKLPIKNGGEKSARYAFKFDFPKGSPKILDLKISLSTTSEEGAIKNLKAEADGVDFEKAKAKTQKSWRDILEKIKIDADAETKTNFYTCLYHAFIQPNNIADADGAYRGADGKISKSQSKKYYSTFSLWDTFRAANSLYCLLAPAESEIFADSMLRHFEVAGRLPIWTLWGRENYCMIGNHAIPVLAEYAAKGIKIDIGRALNACVSTSNAENMLPYINCGYFPLDKTPRASAAKTLEHSYDDHCVALLARLNGDFKTAEIFDKRAQSYKNIFDRETGFMRGKDSAGKWREPFDEFKYPQAGGCGRDYVEANAIQYSWHVLQDPQELIKMHGGNEIFAKRLNALFEAPEKIEGAGFAADATGLIGQYAHGNEPSHHIAYLFALAGAPERTQELAREICGRFYRAKPDGLCGNDDCGQMSAWYVFSALGFYPLSPADAEYVLGAPQVKSAKIKLPNGKTLFVKAKNFSAANKYVKSAKLNGKPVSQKITHSDILKGGTLSFEMSASPERK